MALRFASAAVGLPLLVAVVWAGSPWFSLLVGLVAVLSAMELSNMARRWRDRPITALAVAGAAGLIVGAHFLAQAPSAGNWVPPFVGAAAGLSLLWLQWHAGRGARASTLGISLSVPLLAGGLLFHAPLLRAIEQGREWVLFVLLVTFATDTCAFLTGKAAGKRPLAPSISPSKTWEGAVGGAAGALGAGVALGYVLSLEVTVLATLGLGALIGTVGQLGDLAESRLKRKAGVEDSGRTIPGHGGVLDRLDSIVFNLVVVYYLVS